MRVLVFALLLTLSGCGGLSANLLPTVAKGLESTKTAYELACVDAAKFVPADKTAELAAACEKARDDINLAVEVYTAVNEGLAE